MITKSKDKLEWQFCPNCGENIKSFSFNKKCIKCGLNLKYSKDCGNKFPIKSSLSLENRVQSKNLVSIDNNVSWNSDISIALPIILVLLSGILSSSVGIFILLYSFDVYFFASLATNPYIFALISLFGLVYLIIPLIYIGNYLKNPTLRDRLYLLGFSVRDFKDERIKKTAIEIIIGSILGIVFYFIVFTISNLTDIVFPINEIIESNPGLAEQSIATDLPSLILLIIVMILVVGPTEEVLFRGFMQKGLIRSRLGKVAGIIITAIIFSLIHLQPFLVFLVGGYIEFNEFITLSLNIFFPYLTISLLIGLLFHLRKENLIAAILSHGVYDAMVILAAFILLV